VTAASLAFGAPLAGALIAARCLAGRLIPERPDGNKRLVQP